MKHQLCAILVIVLCFALSACGHTHTWQAANCTSPQLCPECGETQGEALGHTWIEATCVDAKYCSLCLQTIGEPIGHDWTAATCSQPETCLNCGETRGEPLAHNWQPADCHIPETCLNCGETQGKPLEHAVDTWEVIVDSTCSASGIEAGVCTLCEETVERELSPKDHTPGEWIIIVQPTVDEEGTRSRSCTICNEPLETENFTLSAEEIEQLYKDNCKKISYDNLARSPGDYEGEYVTFRGKVVQVCYEAESAFYYSTYRVATSGSYNDVIYIYVDNYGSGSRILEGDWITIYGKFDGLYSYETVMGSRVTIPSVKVEYVD